MECDNLMQSDRQLVRREQVKPKDKIRIQTKNSEYQIEVIDQTRFKIQGGWFDRRKLSPFFGSIDGATWGWGDLTPEIIAKTGMRIQFSNGTTTSQVQTIIISPK